MQHQIYRLVRKLSVFLAIGCFLLFVNGCSQTAMQEVKTPNPNFESGIKFAGQAIAFENLAHSNGTISELTGQRVRYPQLVANIKPNTGQMMVDKLADYFGEEIRKQPGQPSKIVLYTTGSLEDIELASLQGVSLFTSLNGRMHHEFYKASDRNLMMDKRFTVDTDYFMVAELHLLANAAFKNENIKWAAFGSVGNKQGAKVASASTQVNKFGEAVYPYSGILMAGSSSCYNCCWDCGDGGEGTCRWVNETQYDCCTTCDPGDMGGTCGEGRVIAYERSTTGQTTLNKEFAYSFRDGFLKKTPKGKQYIDYYYKLSEFGIKSKTLNNGNMVDHLKLAKLSEDAADILESGQDTDVPITEEYHKEAQKMLGIYKKSADAKENREVQTIVSIIDRDLKRYKGQTRATILQQNGW